MNPQKLPQIVPPRDLPKYAWPAWASCLRWAVGEPKILDAFKAETKLNYKAPQSPVEAMIDEATGYGEFFLDAFIPWFNANVWGAWSDSSPGDSDHA